jgi:hypothetical protein
MEELLPRDDRPSVYVDFEGEETVVYGPARWAGVNGRCCTLG